MAELITQWGAEHSPCKILDCPLPEAATPQGIRHLVPCMGSRVGTNFPEAQLACACGYSRPVVESHIASVLCRDAGQIRYKGPQSAVVQTRAASELAGDSVRETQQAER